MGKVPTNRYRFARRAVCGGVVAELLSESVEEGFPMALVRETRPYGGSPFQPLRGYGRPMRFDCEERHLVYVDMSPYRNMILGKAACDGLRNLDFRNVNEILGGPYPLLQDRHTRYPTYGFSNESPSLWDNGFGRCDYASIALLPPMTDWDWIGYSMNTGIGGFVCHRDLNAAVNLRNLAASSAVSACGEFSASAEGRQPDGKHPPRSRKKAPGPTEVSFG